MFLVLRNAIFFIQVILVSLILIRIFNDNTCCGPVVGVACGGAALQEGETLGFTLALSSHYMVCSREGGWGEGYL